MTAPEGSDSKSVFIVDDDASVRRALTRLLRTEGHHVEAFASAREFLDRHPVPGAGCVILDVSMPGMTGPELHALMSERGITLPVIFLTAHGDVPTSVQAMKRGAVDFLLKPVDDELLLRTVQAATVHDAANSARQAGLEAVKVRIARLSGREYEVMQYVVVGLLNKQIAVDLGISLKTVKVHRGRVMSKMECASVADLVRACEAAGVEHPAGVTAARGGHGDKPER